MPAELSLCYDFRMAPKTLFSSKSSALSFQNPLSKNTSSHVEHSQQSLLDSPHSCAQKSPKKKEIQQGTQEKKDIQQGRIALVPHRIKVAKAQASGVLILRLTSPLMIHIMLLRHPCFSSGRPGYLEFIFFELYTAQCSRKQSLLKSWRWWKLSIFAVQRSMPSEVSENDGEKRKSVSSLLTNLLCIIQKKC